MREQSQANRLLAIAPALCLVRRALHCDVVAEKRPLRSDLSFEIVADAEEVQRLWLLLDQSPDCFIQDEEN